MLNSYPWYIGDWLFSETRRKLTLAQRGVYRDLLDLCYLDGSLPSDRAELRRSLEADGNELRGSLERVLSLFELRDGRYYHRKVDDVRPKLLLYHEAKRHAGAKSGQARRDRKLNTTRTQLEPTPTPTTTPTPTLVQVHNERATQTPPASPISLRFDEWWGLWAPARGTAHRIAAECAWARTVSPDLEDAVMTCTHSYLGSALCADGGGYRPDNFLMTMAEAKPPFSTWWPSFHKNGNGAQSERRLTQNEIAIQTARQKREQAKQRA